MQSYPGLTAAIVPAIASLLGVVSREAGFRAGGEPVYELTVRSAILACDVVLILWPGLGRADVRFADCSMVFKRIDTVELYPGVEVVFGRREPAGYLFLSTGGRASMVV